MSDEISDVLAWLVGAGNIALAKMNIDHEVENYYIKGCPVCLCGLCKCEPYSSRSTNLVDPLLLSDVATRLLELLHSSALGREDLDELYTSSVSTTKTQNDSQCRLFLAQVVFSLTLLRRKYGETEQEKKSQALIDAILKNIENSDVRLK